ncbi:hypothetical protein EDD22DRAFT_1051661 [Suillus occidentalis]|nr:hypothetical protein EDD22DRAFT_1051661 [Suillus occidentalis]
MISVLRQALVWIPLVLLSWRSSQAAWSIIFVCSSGVGTESTSRPRWQIQFAICAVCERQVTTVSEIPENWDSVTHLHGIMPFENIYTTVWRIIDGLDRPSEDTPLLYVTDVAA